MHGERREASPPPRRAARARRRTCAAGRACARSACAPRAPRRVGRPLRELGAESLLGHRGLGEVPMRVERGGKCVRRLRARGRGHGERADEREQGSQRHHFVPAPVAARRARARASAAATAACRCTRSSSMPRTARQPRAPRRPLPRADDCDRRIALAPRSRRARSTRGRPVPSRCNRRGRAERTGHTRCTGPAARCACVSPRRQSRRRGRRRCRACSRCTMPRRSARRRAGRARRRCGRARSTGRPVSVASVAIKSSAPGGQRLIAAPSAIASA